MPSGHLGKMTHMAQLRPAEVLAVGSKPSPSAGEGGLVFMAEALLVPCWRNGAGIPI